MLFLFINFEQSFFILFFALLIFGPKKIPEVARSLGEGIKYLRSITQEIKQKIWETSNYKQNLKYNMKKEVESITKKIDEAPTGTVKRDN